MRKDENDVLLTVRIVPRASKTEVAGMHGDALKIRVKAPPVDGKANLALREFIADTLDVPLGAVAIVSGETGRQKILRVTGASPESLNRLFA